MPVPTRVQYEKNIWVAAGDGDLERVRELIEGQGGDVNITDDDGDTPLYVVENVETARWLVEHGAAVQRQNSEGISPAQCLEEDFPEVATYLNGLNPTADTASTSPSLTQPSQHAQNLASEHLTSSLIQSVQGVMQRAEAEGRDPDEELRQVVERTVLEGMVTGYGMSTLGGQRREDTEDGPTEGPKRTRMGDGDNGQS
ncbi:hypothetical protein EVJ58_g4986 [Rhodofomes roseus]|uniref:Uncharacterized protein n=1 Tax=Rhodofomes roseus TaxID=34475 RepID=A0A4Y9YEQ1_9APHY|nr:hypothetical protein EVJ58_g4986 [Rhodofomes roseus]